MIRNRPHNTRVSRTLVLSLGVLALGLGGMVWAGLNIHAQSPRQAQTDSAPASAPASDASGQAAPVRSAVVSAGLVNTMPEKKSGSVRTVSLQRDTPRRIGSLYIPALKQKFPVYEGTGVNELRKGVGHYSRSVMPGQNDNCVLSGHRDTVFTRLGRLKKGNRLVVTTSAGRFTYRIRRIRIVDKEDRTVIVPTNHAVLTVTTCYPFRYIGSAPKRYVLSADLVRR